MRIPAVASHRRWARNGFVAQVVADRIMKVNPYFFLLSLPS